MIADSFVGHGSSSDCRAAVPRGLPENVLQSRGFRQLQRVRDANASKPCLGSGSAYFDGVRRIAKIALYAAASSECRGHMLPACEPVSYRLTAIAA